MLFIFVAYQGWVLRWQHNYSDEVRMCASQGQAVSADTNQNCPLDTDYSNAGTWPQFSHSDSLVTNSPSASSSVPLSREWLTLKSPANIISRAHASVWSPVWGLVTIVSALRYAHSLRGILMTHSLFHRSQSGQRWHSKDHFLVRF